MATSNRLDRSAAESLFSPQTELHALGQRAHAARLARHGRRVYYNVNAHLNPTNICRFRCGLCAYSCDPGDPRGYVMSIDEALAQATAAVADGATELHVVGGVHPDLPYSWYLDLLRTIHQAFPQLHLKAFSAVEVAQFAEQSGRPIAEVLRELVEAGLASLPGGGAEIFAPEVRARICPRKADAETWLAVHRIAHRSGLRTNATMLYGHVETTAQRVDHLLRLRDLQDETGGFQAFIPLAFHPANTALAELAPPTAMDDLRVVAASRLILDNFDHIKAYWISLGVATAQVALSYGADDLDGTVCQERIHHDAGSTAPQALRVAELEHLIREAGFEPVQRDSLYRAVAG